MNTNNFKFLCIKARHTYRQRDTRHRLEYLRRDPRPALNTSFKPSSALQCPIRVLKSKFFYISRLGLVSPLAFSPQHSAAIMSLYGATDFQRSAACWYPWSSLAQPFGLASHHHPNTMSSRSPPPAHQSTHRSLGLSFYLINTYNLTLSLITQCKWTLI